MKVFNRFLTFLALLLTVLHTYGQEYYNIKIPERTDYIKRCRECTRLINSKPKEIQFFIQKDEFGNLYFVSTQREWFESIIKGGKDGIAIDIVSKDRYNCLENIPNHKSPIRGDLQKPMYSKNLKHNILSSNNGEIVIKIGVLPEKYKDQDNIEFNIVFIKNRYLCHYSSSLNIKTYRWGLLDMGFYFDTLTHKIGKDSLLIEQKRYSFQNKIMKFEVPFEKNKSEYSIVDVNPLYDSLNLTDFNIHKITIRAYSSIEGNEKRNEQLQQERAQSIVDALQSYQKPTITTEISASENWVDFLNDVSNTSYSYLTGLSKDTIRDKLKDKKLISHLEPYLQKHRKAIIILELQKKNRFEDISVVELTDLFSQAISEKNIKQAIDIQNSIFEKVINHEISSNYIDQLEIPEKSEFSILLNKQTIFKHLMDEIDILTAYQKLEILNNLTPNETYIKYNICALKFKIWLLDENTIDPVDFKKEINDLKKWGIPNKLIKRMLINYEIIMGEYYMIKEDFSNKDRSLRYIYSNYQSVSLSETDLLSLAQYFASYAKYDWAIKLLEKKVKSVDVDENTLFYYLNLTLADERLIKRPDYRTILLNAYNLNPTRFCKIFESSEKGGMTFQLLENDYLKKEYCENCKF